MNYSSQSSGSMACDADEILRLAGHATTIEEKAALIERWRFLPRDAQSLSRKRLARALGINAADLQGVSSKIEDETEWELVREHSPSPELVDGAALLDGISGTFTKFISLPPHSADAAALWALQTHAAQHDAFETAPFLNLSSPEKRCGKTEFLRLLEAVCARPLSSVGATNATLFRTIHACRPTVIIDETDRLFQDPKKRPDLISTLNAGHRRGAVIPRCVGDRQVVRPFRCFAPYLLAGIGDLPDTIRDRAIVVPMQRKPPGVRIVRRSRDTYAQVWRLGEFCARWALEHAKELSSAVTEVPRPELLDDRACDIWEPLFAVARVAGGEWPSKALNAALALSGGRDSESPSIGSLLLADIRVAFDGDPKGRRRLTTATILSALNSLSERPWKSWREGMPLDDRGLARILHPFGIKSTTVRSEDERAKGYRREDFESAWASYVAPTRA